jgi:hypothetical protein
MDRLKFLVVALFIGSALSFGQAASQTPTRPPNMMDTLNQEAGAGDADGIHAYSKHLIQMLPGVRGAGAAYADALTDRLAGAEIMARHGKRKLISEIEIAEAFNDLMRQTGAPASLKADLNSVELARRGWEKELPALISREKNGTYCYPGEAIWVLTIMIANIEAHYPTFPPGESRMVSGYRPPVELHLQQYFSSHSPNEAAHVMDRLATRLRF